MTGFVKLGVAPDRTGSLDGLPSGNGETDSATQREFRDIPIGDSCQRGMVRTSLGRSHHTTRSSFCQISQFCKPVGDATAQPITGFPGMNT